MLYRDTIAIFGSDVYFSENSEVRIKEGTTKVGAYAFAKCENITKVVLPNSVAYIGDYAFEVCKNLNEVIIHGNVTSIGEYAFMENFVLTNITYNGTKEPVLGDGVFESCTLLNMITVSQKYEADTFGGYNINKPKEVSVTIAEDGTETIVQNLQGKAMLIVASYKDDALIDCAITGIDGDGNYKLSDMNGLVYDKAKVDSISVYIWQDMIDFKPICKNDEHIY